MWMMDTFIGRFFANSKPLSVGRDCVLDMALGEDKNTSGLFYMDNKPHDEAAEVYDGNNQKRIWSLCVKYSGL